MSPRVRIRRRVAGAVAICVAAFALTSCTERLEPEHDSLREVCRIAGNYIDSTADPLKIGRTDQFAETPDLLNGQSLYYTSWALQLYDGDLPGMYDREFGVSTFSDLLHRASTADDGLPMSQVESIRLAIQALLAIDPNWSTEDDPFERLRVGSGYSFNAGELAAPGATAIALQVQALASIPTPSAVVEDLRLEASTTVAKGVDLQEMTSTSIPNMLALSTVLTPQEFRIEVPEAQAIVEEWIRANLASGSSVIEVGNIFQLWLVTRAQSLHWDQLPDGFGAELRTPGGLFSATPNGGGDPQVTGMLRQLLPEEGQMSLPPGLDAGLTPHGWLATFGAPSLAAYAKVAISRELCGKELPLFPEDVDGWVRGVGLESTTSSTDMYFICAVLSMNGHSLAAGDADLVRGALSARFQNGDTLALAQALMADHVCQTGAAEASSGLEIPAGEEPTTSLAAYAANLVEDASANGGAQIEGESADPLERFRTGGTYGYLSNGSNEHEPDIYSTALGLRSANATSQEVLVALDRFDTGEGWSMEATEPGWSGTAQLSSMLMPILLTVDGDLDQTFEPLMLITG